MVRNVQLIWPLIAMAPAIAVGKRHQLNRVAFQTDPSNWSIKQKKRGLCEKEEKNWESKYTQKYNNGEPQINDILKELVKNSQQQNSLKLEFPDLADESRLPNGNCVSHVFDYKKLMNQDDCRLEEITKIYRDKLKCHRAPTPESRFCLAADIRIQSDSRLFTYSDNWFRELFGFNENDIAKQNITVAGNDGELTLNVNNKPYRIGKFMFKTSAELNQELFLLKNKTTIKTNALLEGFVKNDTNLYLVGFDSANLARLSQLKNGFFMGASQMNLLEMAFPHVEPKVGITGYWEDSTLGPKLALVNPQNVLFRNYLIKVKNGTPNGFCAKLSHGCGQLEKQLNAVEIFDKLLSPTKGYHVLRSVNGYCYAASEKAKKDLENISADRKLQNARNGVRIGLTLNSEVVNVKFHEDSVKCPNKEIPEAPAGHSISTAFVSGFPLQDQQSDFYPLDPPQLFVDKDIAKANNIAVYETSFLGAAFNFYYLLDKYINSPQPNEKSLKDFFQQNPGADIIVLAGIGAGVWKNPVKDVVEAIHTGHGFYVKKMNKLGLRDPLRMVLNGGPNFFIESEWNGWLKYLQEKFTHEKLRAGLPAPRFSKSKSRR